MSDLPDNSAPAEETPAQHIAAVQKQKNFYRRITSSMPLLVTVIVHVLLIGGAAAIVVQQSGGAKKKTFEASNQTEVSNKQVEHRLQVARRGGASSSSQSPVSANRIFSTAENALQMPAMPDLPSMGAGGFGGFAGMGAGVGMGAGSGMSTSLGGGTGLGGRGFMSLSFLGSTTQNVRNVVFVVDTSKPIMAEEKSGFSGFKIIREEIMRLVGRLPPSSKFNVVLFEGTYSDANDFAVNVFSNELVEATNDNKKDFFAWMTPVNSKLDRLGPNSALSRTAWRRKALPVDSGIDPLFLPPVWARATHAALEQQPDVVYVITGTAGQPRIRADEETLRKRREDLERARAELAREGFDLAVTEKAQHAAYAKARVELNAVNAKLVAAKKDPIIVQNNEQIFSAAVQARLKREGYTINLDPTGWSRKDGSLIRNRSYISSAENTEWTDFYTHFSRLQKALLPERAIVNIFLFVGPKDKPEKQVEVLTSTAKRNGGTFQLLTTKRLEEIKAREDAAASKN
jgi:type II secretory pathway pseudopilin PulG